MPSESVTIEGHIIDSLILPSVLDEIVEAGGRFEIRELRLGQDHKDLSFARIEVSLDEPERLAELLERLRQHGANAEGAEDAKLTPADRDGAFPPGFHSSTNLETEVRVKGRWLSVEHTEMDCGIVVDGDRATTLPMTEVRTGMQVVMAGPGVRVRPPEAPVEDRQAFEFMSSTVSSEKPKALLVQQVADRLEAAKQAGGRILWVAGPAVVHTGSAPDLCALIRGGYVDAFFAGNGLAAHDIESNMFGTSLGVHLSHGTPAEFGHEHHIRAINEIRRHGSFAAAIEAGVFSDGIVHALVDRGVDYLFGGSVRDDGPLPEVVTDMVEVQRRLRGIIWGNGVKEPVAFCIVLGTMLHGIATGNCLPASVPLVCVDINQATVTKLMDRGSHQSIGVITDVGLFVRELAERLVPDQVTPPEEHGAARRAGARSRR